MIDTHTHLYLKNDYGSDMESAVARAKNAGVSHLILPNIDVNSISEVEELHKLYPDCTSMAMGLHPTEVTENWESDLGLMAKELSKGGFKAIGETGIDLHWDTSNIEFQKKAFARQLEMAEEYGLPVIIHSRDAFEETLEIIEDVKPGVPLVFHSFTGGIDDVKRIREVCDPYFGINGVVTYKNAPGLREALTEIGVDRILLETDAPFLSPVPQRGKRNESSYLPYIRDKVAECLGISLEEVEKTTDYNAKAVFGI